MTTGISNHDSPQPLSLLQYIASADKVQLIEKKDISVQLKIPPRILRKQYAHIAIMLTINLDCNNGPHALQGVCMAMMRKQLKCTLRVV